MAHLKRRDKVLASLIAKYDPPMVTLRKNYYESIIEAIIYQQISGKAGAAIMKRFKTLYNGRLPNPKRFLETDEKLVRSSGVSPQKYTYLKDLCMRIENGELELKKFEAMDDEDVISELDDVRGIGRWTSEMFLIFTLGRIDVVPNDDLGIKKAIKREYKLRELPGKEKFTKLSKVWSPYGTIASLYLWRSLDGENGGWA